MTSSRIDLVIIRLKDKHIKLINPNYPFCPSDGSFFTPEIKYSVIGFLLESSNIFREKYKWSFSIVTMDMEKEIKSVTNYK